MIMRTLNSNFFGMLTDMLNNTRNDMQIANIVMDLKGYQMTQCLSRKLSIRHFKHYSVNNLMAWFKLRLSLTILRF